MITRNSFVHPSLGALAAASNAVALAAACPRRNPSNLSPYTIVYQYLGFEIDATHYPNLAQYLQGTMATAAFQRALADERPFVDQMGLKRDFLSAV
jgi:hypothetical protein